MARMLAGVAVASLIVAGCGRSGVAPGAAGAGRVIEVTDADFAEATARGVVLLEFYTPMCGWCTKQAPVLEQIAGDFAGRASIAKLNAAGNRKTAGRFGLPGVPVLVVLKDGKEVERFVGFTKEGKLSAALEKALAR